MRLPTEPELIELENRLAYVLATDHHGGTGRTLRTLIAPSPAIKHSSSHSCQHSPISQTHNSALLFLNRFPQHDPNTSERRANPLTTTYMLELTQDELFHLFALLSMRTIGIPARDGLNDEEVSVLDKVQRLMEGK